MMNFEMLCYSRSDDFDMDGAEWIPASTFGSAYEQEINVRSSPSVYRHRDFFARGPWVKGPAPDRK